MVTKRSVLLQLAKDEYADQEHVDQHCCCRKHQCHEIESWTLSIVMLCEIHRQIQSHERYTDDPSNTGAYNELSHFGRDRLDVSSGARIGS